MQNTTSRILSLLLALVMVLSMVPTVFAAEDSVSVTYVAENTTTGVQYENLDTAIAEAQAGQIVKALADAENVTYGNEGVILDLNGHDLSVTVAEGVTLSAIDSATDDYEGEYGSLTTDGTVATTVKTAGEVKSYVTIAENGSYTFHRYYAAIAAISLKPTQVALGYRAEFRGDEAVKNAVVEYGYKMWVNSDAVKTYSRKDALEKSSLTLRLKNIMAEGNVALNSFGANATIGGNAFIVLNSNGQEIFLYGTAQHATLRGAVEAVNANVGSYGEAQLQPVREMITTYASWMEGWEVDAIFGNGESEGDDTDLNVEITVDITAENDTLTQDAVLIQDDVSATVPQGAVLEEGTTQLVLTVAEKTDSDSGVSAQVGESLLSLDVHVQGISANNAAAILVCLGQILPEGLSIGNYDLYHVENGETVQMTRVNSLAVLDAHNEYCYDPATGTVTVAMASFSEVAVLSSAAQWEGGEDTSWYNTSDTTFVLYNADQLAGFGKIVDGTADGIAADTFEGKTVKLGANIDLGSAAGQATSFDPIGFGYETSENGRVFKGTFDGDGYTIYNLYQNGWDLGLSYSTAGGGLFASAVDAQFRNLTISGANIVMECIDMGTLVGYAYGTCSFENIQVTNSVVANYNRYTGGLVGEVNGNHTFNNITIDHSVTLSALWGTFDPSVGGIIGGKYGEASVKMNNCTVACKMDVYNDVTSAYEWYAYRRCGMLLGLTEESAKDANGTTVATASFLECTNCTVYYSGWTQYTYCQFSNEAYPWVRTQAGLHNDAYSNARYGHPTDANGNTVVDANHTHQSGDSCTLAIPFNQLYGGGQGVYGAPAHPGVTIKNYVYAITYVVDDEIYGVDYVESNDTAYTQLMAAPVADNKTFDSWVTVAGVSKTSINAGNTADIVLYAKWQNLYTVRFVNHLGNVVASAQFNPSSGALTSGSVPADYVSGDFTYSWSHYQTITKGATGDVVVGATQTYGGVLNLYPHYDEYGNLVYYSVQAQENPDEFNESTVQIPGSVNGVPVKVVEQMFGGSFGNYVENITTIEIGEGVEELQHNALSYTPNLATVKLPSTLTTMGKNTFSRNDFLGQDKKKLTIEFNGTKAEWDAIVAASDENWAGGLEDGSTVVCSDGIYTLSVSWLGTKTWKWTAS